MESYFTFYSGNLDLFVRSVGHFDLRPGERSRIKHADFGEIFWCIEGSGKFKDADGREFTLETQARDYVFEKLNIPKLLPC